ncbi:hypothetical protein NA57DRAFT_73085 [Rhizodiscina lignyota]|uniref:Cupin type-2 domain-containing protein n=1 Tax=Rhizodiscina lignyota TaxID=1504668 RepID=A0A9P4IHG1_9PEZI|nr:hypothetical protein NA57DRAFT_73085 [Rhizodiscina lignyota]
MSVTTYVPFGLSDPGKRTIRNPIFQDEVEFLEYANETGGKYCKARVTLRSGGGNPLHYHTAYVETFECEKGVLGVEHNGETKHLEAGEKVDVQIGNLHRFFNPSETETVIFLCSVTPADDGWEKLLHIVYGFARDGLVDKEGVPANLYHLLYLMKLGDTNLPGIGMWFLAQAAVLVHWHARWSGEEDRLLRKYYGTPATEDDKKK